MGAYVDRQLVDHDLKGLLQIAGPKFSNLECSIEYELLEAKCRSASRDRLCPQHLDQYEVCFHLQLVPFEMRNQQHQLRLCACNPLINTTLMASSSKGAFQLQEYPRASDSVFQSQPAPLCQKGNVNELGVIRDL